LAVLVEKIVVSHDALAWYELEKNVASQECGGHETVKISPQPQQLAPNLGEGEAAKKQSI
jgi:hypothetical protein